jgi:hypothetical protein
MNIEGTYTRKRDGVICSYQVECRGLGGAALVAWDASVYVDDRLVGTPGGQMLASGLSLEALEQAVRDTVERIIEGNVGIHIFD